MNEDRKIARLALAMLATIESHRFEGLSLDHLGVLYSNHSDDSNYRALLDILRDKEVELFEGFDGSTWVRATLYTCNEVK